MNSFEMLDKMRESLKNKYLMFVVLGIIAIIVLWICKIGPQFYIMCIFATVVIAILCTNKDARQYKIAFKRVFVKNALEEIFTDLKYEPERAGLPQSIIAQTNMMYMGDRYNSNDLIEGKYKGIGFKQSDVHIERKETYIDSDGHRRTTYVTIFKGRWMIFDFNKHFKANVQVCQKMFGNNKTNSLFSQNTLKKVEMESQEFNKAFKVYAEQPIDAFYILTPKIMEKIINLDNRNKGKLLLCFIDNKLHVGIYDNKDSFENGNVFTKINPEEIKQKILDDILKITMFVDELELDNDLFK